MLRDRARIWASVYKWRTPSRWRAEDLHKPFQLEGEGGLENPAMENQNGERIPMQRYFSAVRHMEQTVMFPSLLQGVLLEDQEDPAGIDSEKECPRDRDLYDYFTLLKSIKSTAESGLPPLNEKCLSSREEEEAREKTDLEGLFRYHISGLYHVLTQLTTRANAVTSRYNEILGQINQNAITFRW
ncbi:thyroid hormone-inducible hepatic protein [Notechis scutatus]|uniref:Thyroid hormone-inducible hepatic protein n=1 Tax=Notechis scutatus TaxID=8663 RepID=A0A6J1VWD1_9SAUR|nr:thyroid hormone-inducible hepatic protein [Notechis scutatus]